MQEQSETPPWEQAKSHARLWIDRSKAATKEEQNELAPQEHKAFAKELVAEKPWMAPSLAVAIPAYQVQKAVMGGTRSDPSMTQVTEAYKGIGEGLAEAASKPWEIAKEWAKRLLQGEKPPSRPSPTRSGKKRSPTVLDGFEGGYTGKGETYVEGDKSYMSESGLKDILKVSDNPEEDKTKTERRIQMDVLELTQEIARTKDPKLKKILKDYQASLKGNK